MRIGNLFKHKVVSLIIAASKDDSAPNVDLVDIGDSLYSMLIDEDELAYMKQRPRLFTWARKVMYKGRSLPLSKPMPFPSSVPDLSDDGEMYIDSMLDGLEAKKAEEKQEHDALYAVVSKCSTLKSILVKEPNIFPFVVAALSEGKDAEETKHGIPVSVLRILQDEGMCDDLLMRYVRNE